VDQNEKKRKNIMKLSRAFNRCGGFALNELPTADPLTCTVTGYWLRSRMNKAREAQLLRREGLKNLPDRQRWNSSWAGFTLRTITTPPCPQRLGARAQPWQKQEASKPDPDNKF